jgi:anaphase-promoting complex subunit 10
VSKVCFYLDYGSDESYTPKKIAIRSGTSLHDLFDLTAIELNDPVGWVSVSLTNPEGDGAEDGPLRTHFLQIKIFFMHQNGRDAHVRQIKILGPRDFPKIMGGLYLDQFKTPEMLQYSTVR